MELHQSPIWPGDEENAVDPADDKPFQPVRERGIVQQIYCRAIVGAPLERRIDRRPPGAEKPGQTVSGETEVQTVKGFTAP